ncbi:MAG: hypothetical protein Q8P49_00845 [Candidatus Liptonbacteria bacterium]|nr:hypothetical protein [Candidatus Liptonbacteria bacterium]
MNKKLIPFCVIGIGMLASAFIVGMAVAQTSAGPDAAGINYPISELGNCKDKSACKTYCDDPAHLEACIAFAEKNNLMSKGEIDTAKKFLNAGGKGPGGCTNKDSCEAYCNDIRRINECVAFAEKTGIMPPGELAEAKQVQSAIARGVKPPPCNNKKECDAYCEDPSHMKVCVAFGEAAGFLQGKELEDAKKIMAAIDNGVTPPPCKGKKACDAYCSDPSHLEACMTFAQVAGLMSPREAQDSQKMLQALKKGVKPPACRGREECDKYCAEDAHIEECINFAIAAGFMSEKDAEMAKKTKGRGPGNCRGKEECEAFCNNPDNQQACMNFAKDNGLISPEELQKMQEGQKKFQESFQGMPPEVLTCLQGSVGSDLLEKIKSGQAMPSRDIGEKVGQCFSQMGGPGQGMRPGGSGAGGEMPPGGGQMMGPRPDGQNFQGQPVPAFGSFSGPGGCKTPQECMAYCQSNPEACRDFRPPTMGPGMTPMGQEFPTGIQPNMPPQDGIMPPPPTGIMPPPDGTQPMMQQGTIQPPADYVPPPDGTLQPQSYNNPPTLGQFMLGMISIFFR